MRKPELKWKTRPLPMVYLFFLLPIKPLICSGLAADSVLVSRHLGQVRTYFGGAGTLTEEALLDQVHRNAAALQQQSPPPTIDDTESGKDNSSDDDSSVQQQLRPDSPPPLLPSPTIVNCFKNWRSDNPCWSLDRFAFAQDIGKSFGKPPGSMVLAREKKSRIPVLIKVIYTDIFVGFFCLSFR